MSLLPNISEIFYLDPIANTILPPQLILTTRSFKPIGLIKYTNWNFSLTANGMDGFAFDVYKPVDITEDMNPKQKLLLTYEKKIWDSLVDLKLIYIQDYGRFEISVDYTDNTKTVKSVHAVSLECELAQALLYDFHVNDDEAMATMEVNEYNKVNFDNQGNFIPTTLCNFSDPEHSLIHRVLADKAPHWTVGNQDEGTGYFTPFVSFDEGEDPELSKEFQRTYTCDGESIYDFLTGKVAHEANVIFVFDTINRIVNCYSLTDCVMQHSKEVMATAIGEDTNVFVSKEKLANEITITSAKDNVKNCFRIEGGDDIINAMVAVANVNGSNYITQFSEFQYEDMSDELREVLEAYAKAIKEAQPEYEKLYLKLCEAYDELYEYESSMMPQVATGETDASDEFRTVDTRLNEIGLKTSYTSNAHVGVTNNIQTLAQAYVASNYDVKVVDGSTSYNEYTKVWTGQLKIINTLDETDTTTGDISVTITDDELVICEQKIEKALAKGDMLNVKFDIEKYQNSDGSLNESAIRSYFEDYSLNRLKSFYDGYESCISILVDMGKNKDQESEEYKFYSIYVTIRDIIGKIKAERQTQVDAFIKATENLSNQCATFQEKYNMQTYFKEYFGTTSPLGNQCYKEYCAYRREDTYSNPNYISDGLSDSECLKKAQELVKVAQKEIKKACVLQRTLAIDMNNLFMLKEFDALYSKFSLFNFIRVETDDEILKLRIIGIDINGSSLSNVDITFSDQIESIDGSINDLQSILSQAQSVVTSFPSTIRQAKKGETAQQIIGSLRKNGLIASQTLISNADNNEVTYGGFGILCKNEGDSGNYGMKQLRVIGNGIYLTKDAWKTVEMAIGEINVNGVEKYGLIADTIIAGTIIGGSGDTYWNLDTGVFHMGTSTTVDGTDGDGNITNKTLSEFVVDLANGVFESRIENESGDMSQIRQELTEITTRVENAEGEISTIKQEAGEIESRVANAEGNISTLTQTAESIRAEMNTADGKLNSKIEQTASGIINRVEKIEGDYVTNSVFEQTAGLIRAEISDGDESLNSKIEQTAGIIRSEISAGDASLNTKIEQTASEIDLCVKDSDFNGQEIARRINIGTEGVLIQGDKIILDGTVTANESFKILTDGSAEATSIVVENEISTNTLNVETINNGQYQKTLTSSPTIYVNANSGDDDQECIDGAVFQTLQGAINSIPKFLNGRTVYIELQTDVTENVNVNYFSAGRIYIYLAGHTLYGHLYSTGCPALWLYGGTKSGSGTDMTGTIHPSTGVSIGGYTTSIGVGMGTTCYMTNLKTIGADNLLSGTSNRTSVGVQYGLIYATNIEITNTQIGFRANAAGRLYCASSSGIASTYGFFATSGGHIMLNSTSQAGGVSKNVHENNGGTVKYHSPTHDTGSASSSGSTATTTKTTKTVTYTANKGNAIQNYGTSSAKWRSDNSPKVGTWGYGNHIAFWFFGDKFENIKNKDVSKIEITFTRNSGGNSSAVTHYFYAHNYGSQPSTVTPTYYSTRIGSASVATGNSKTITITDSSLISAIISRKGICSIPPSQSTTYYSVMSGTMKVKFTYTE